MVKSHFSLMQNTSAKPDRMNYECIISNSHLFCASNIIQFEINDNLCAPLLYMFSYLWRFHHNTEYRETSMELQYSRFTRHHIVGHIAK